MSDTYTEQEVRECLSALGIKHGDCIFIHSALKSVGRLVPSSGINGLDSLLNILLDVVGEGGTIVVPTFNFAFCRGERFDRNKTPCDGMGVFSEYVRNHTRAYRSNHPFHSVAAIGGNAKAITDSVGFSEFSDGSFFDALLKLDCKILFYGINFVETFVHMAEERAKVPYRSWKTFTGEVVNDGVVESVKVNFYARKFDLEPQPKIDVEKINQYLIERKIITSRNLGLGKVSLCSSRKMVGELIEKFAVEPLFPLVKNGSKD